MLKYLLLILFFKLFLHPDILFPQSLKDTKYKGMFKQDKSLTSWNNSKFQKIKTLSGFNINEFSNTGTYSSAIKKKSPLSNYVPYESRKHFAIAVGELALIEFIPYAYARWIRDWSKTPDEMNWTKLTWESEWNNISSGFEYDGDNFITNYFAHPYHGNLYFNTGRTNGYNFWESSAFAFTGSALWEFFAETFRPSFNDWVSTSVNGICFGESLYRLSGMITDNQATGSERVWREIGGAIVNPVRGFNRLISGETNKIFPNPEYGRPSEFSILLSGGLRSVWNDTSTTAPDTSAYEQYEDGFFSLSAVYGNAFKSKDPFSHFSFAMALTSADPKFTELYASGFLYGWNLKKSKKTNHKLKFDLEYNYTNNPGFLFGETAVIPNILSSFKIGKKTNLITNFGINGVLMGGTPNDYDTLSEGRTYDMGPGIGGRAIVEIRGKTWSYLTAGYYGFYIFTTSEPSNSQHYLHYATLKLKFPIKDYFAIGVEGGIYWKNSMYDFNPDVNKQVPIARLLFYTLM